MNILITGGCGFIGVNFISNLREKSSRDHIKVLDNLTLGKKEYVAGYDVEFIKGDIRDENLVGSILSDVDTIVHLAADTRVIPSIEQPGFNFDVNVVGTYNLLNQAKKNRVNRFIFASTGGAILGEAIPPVHEGMIPKPISPYGASKLCGEAYCSAFAGSYGMQTVSLRFSNIYGPRSYHKGSVIAHFMKRILAGENLVIYGDGTQTRDYINVEDICLGILDAMSSGKSGVFQLGTGKSTTLNELIKILRTTVNDKFKINVEYKEFRPGEIKHTWSNIDKAKREIGFNPTIDLPKGLSETWEWFRRNYDMKEK